MRNMDADTNEVVKTLNNPYKGLEEERLGVLLSGREKRRERRKLKRNNRK